MSIGKRIYTLDVVKILASICIIFHHYQGEFGVQFSHFNFHNGRFYFGYLVELFFIISGFFTFPTIKKIGTTEDFSHFFKKRCIRLLPINAISAMAHCVVIFLFFNGIHVWGWVVSAFGMFAIDESFSIYNINAPCWYVSVLLICNIWFYCITWWSKKKEIQPRWAYIIMVVLGLLIQHLDISVPFFNSHTSRGYFAFFVGILLHQFIEEHSISNKLQLCAVTIFISFSLVYLFKGHFISNGFIFLLTLFVYPSIIIICLSPICQKLFRFPILGILGEVSFGMYLWHTPIFQFFTYINSKFDLKIPFHSVSMMIFSAGVITFIGFISFYCIEKPISKYFSSKTLSKTP